MFTRADYMNAPPDERWEAHRKWYGQFVTPELKDYVEQSIGRERILASSDPKSFNDIRLRKWDRLIPVPEGFALGPKMRRAGDVCGGSLSDRVCVCKEAARQIREEALAEAGAEEEA